MSKIDLPVIVKTKEGSLLKYSHHFFICATESALMNALKFEGFQDKQLLI